MKRFLISGLGLILLVLVVAAWRYQDDLFELRKNFEIFGALYEEIALNYVDEVRPQPFMRSGIESMLLQLDPYTQYYDEADMVDIQLMQQRKVGTVGLNVGLRGGRLTVLAPEHNAAAYRQGIRTGDIVIQIGETSTENLTVGEAYELLMGQPNTTIGVLIQRGNEETPRQFVLPRSLPRTQNVSFSGYLGADSTQGIAYVRLDQFGNRAGREVKRAFRNMHRDVPLNGMVLDLRGNPGGIVSEAMEIVALFVPKGSLVVSTRSRLEGVVQELRTEEDPLFPDIPVVVLVDRFSASASEIVAGALQDYDRAVIMGETSFGKGLVQTTRALPHNTLLKLTISHYYLPTGRTIQSFSVGSSSTRVVVPASTTYTTAKGRTVRGGFGVEPDSRIETPDVGGLESALLQESAFFLFADRWVEDHCRGNSMCLNDMEVEYNEFLKWLPTSGIRLATEADVLVSRLESQSRAEGYEMTAELDALQRALELQKSEQLRSLESSVLGRIETEIRSRLLSEAHRIQLEVRIDPWISRADQLVRDPKAMSDILN